MKKKKYLPIYNQFMEHGLNRCGLCNVFNDDEIFKLFRPTSDDYELMEWSTLCWASGWKNKEFGEIYGNWEFSPIRQNIVLLMAAMNNEL